MLRRTIVLGAAASTLLMLGACRSEKPDFFETYVEGLNQATVEKSVLRGAAARGWNTKVIKPGYIVATYVKGQHIACVDIRYNATGYRITKNSKTNMDARDGGVDAKFNQWVRNLNQSIKRAAAVAKVQ